MFIPLKTIDVWHVDGEFSASLFFQAIRLLASDGDMLALGTYNPCDEAYDWLSHACCKQLEKAVPYFDSFDLNRDQFPRGRAFILRLDNLKLEGIQNLLKLEQGSFDKPLFFDHCVLYRSTPPLLPLLSFHDAFNGGTLLLSGLYTKRDLEAFFNNLSVKGVLLRNAVEVGVVDPEQ